MKRIFIAYTDLTLFDVADLVNKYEGYFDADRQQVVFPFNPELAEELENRGIRFKVEMIG